MTKSMLQIAVLIAVMAAVVLGFTTDVRAQCGGDRCVEKIDRLFTHSSLGIVYVGTAGDERNLACIASQGVYVVLNSGQPLFREIYDSFLAGLTHNLTVTVDIVTGSNLCQIGYVIVHNNE